MQGRSGAMTSTIDDIAVWTWDAVVRAHAARVYRLAYRLTGNRHDAEDLTQDVFVRIFRYLPTYRPGVGTLEGWLHRVTTNLFIDQARRRQRIRLEPLDGDWESQAGSVATPDELYEARAVDDDVQTALEALPLDFRTAVVLRDVEGLAYDEIATALNIKVATVATRIHRGRRLLREALTDRPRAEPRP
jgi:RNA polymerase sigma-70 factor, ECF subfamily